MKIAYLIMAHTDPSHLGRLIAALGREHAVFVHIDKKVNAGPFAHAVQYLHEVELVDDRVEVNWGGFSVVRATLQLMRRALQSPEACDYLVLLSGLDYPIKNAQFIADYFRTYRGREFIRYANVLEHSFLTSKIDRMHFQDNRLYRLTSRGLERMLGRGVRDAIQPIVLKKRPLPNGMVPYFGSQWWALTRDCAEYVLRFVDSNPAFVGFYRSAGIPDEMFFHTIIMNSPFGAKTNTRAEDVRWSDGHVVREAGDLIKYTDWSLNRERPAILDERDFPALERSTCLYARKFNSLKSMSLIDRIDRELLGAGGHTDRVPGAFARDTIRNPGA